MEGIKNIYSNKSHPKYKNIGTICLNKVDSMEFLIDCESNQIPIHVINIFSIGNSFTTPYSIILDFNVDIYDYETMKRYLEESMDEKWNYAEFIIE